MSAIPKILDDYRVGELLDVWERYMKASAENVMELGYPKKSVGLRTEPWGYWEDTFDLMCDEVEWGKAEAVNAAIDDLEQSQQMSIYHKHLYAVFRFNRLDLEHVYQAARDTLAIVLPRKAIY